MRRWNKDEINSLTKLFSSTPTEDLALQLDRSYSSIVYKAGQLKLLKDPNKYNQFKRLKPEIYVSKELFENLYLKQEKSIRTIASELGLGKNTVDYYLIKYQIPKRTAAKSNSIYYKKNPNWCKGRFKENDNRILKISEKVKRTWKLKKEERIKLIEKEYQTSFRKIILNFYYSKGYSQEKIATELGFSRTLIIEFMKEFNIPKRDNFREIVRISKINHPHKGLTWEEIHSPIKAKKLRKAASLRSRKLILERISKKDFPFYSTKIEKKMERELKFRNIPFVSQLKILKKFSLDFAIPSKRIAIECDGDYWHSNPDIYCQHNLSEQQKEIKQRDLNKDRELRENGWIVLRFFETDINKDTKKCVDLIEFIYKKS